jgi:hypothetical protein
MSTPAERPQRKTLQRHGTTAAAVIAVIAAPKRHRNAAATFGVSAKFLETLQRARTRTPPTPTLPDRKRRKRRKHRRRIPQLLITLPEESEDSEELYGPDPDEVCWVPFTSALEHNVAQILKNL